MPNTFYELKKPVFFVGFMGAGKSSISRRLARNCGIASVDMDKYIERSTGRKIPEIFASDGEGCFRDIETETLRDFAGREDCMLISCGGGIVTREENRSILRDSGFVVHLKVDADEAASRISDKSSRPLFNDIESARKRCQDRLPQYSQVADVEIDTSGKSVFAIMNEVQSALEKKGILCQLRK